jgi:hypothetical protein
MDHTKPMKREDVLHSDYLNRVFNFAALTRDGWFFPSGPQRQKFLACSGVQAFNFMLRLDN